MKVSKRFTLHSFDGYEEVAAEFDAYINKLSVQTNHTHAFVGRHLDTVYEHNPILYGDKTAEAWAQSSLFYKP